MFHIFIYISYFLNIFRLLLFCNDTSLIKIIFKQVSCKYNLLSFLCRQKKSCTFTFYSILRILENKFRSVHKIYKIKKKHTLYIKDYDKIKPKYHSKRNQITYLI